MSNYDFMYENYLRDVFENGVSKGDRTGTGTLSVFGRMMRFNLRQGFPLITTKKVFMKGIIRELLWFLKGSSNIKYLVDNGVHIWDEWADENGDLGPVYGVQWRSWPGEIHIVQLGEKVPCESGITHHCQEQPNGDLAVHGWSRSIDQIANVVARIKAKPDDRRLIVTAWNPAEIDKMKLPPCHMMFQFWTRELSFEERSDIAYARVSAEHFGALVDFHATEAELDAANIPKRALSCMLYQRSCDSFLGVPFNIASYALLTEMVAQQCDMVAEEFVWNGGDCHIYSNHISQVKEQLSRTITADYPKLQLRKAASIFDYEYEDIQIIGYDSHGKIEAPIAV